MPPAKRGQSKPRKRADDDDENQMSIDRQEGSSAEDDGEDNDGDDGDVEHDESPRRSRANNPIGSFTRRLGFKFFRFKERAKIRSLEHQLTKKQKRFGVNYMDLIETGASQQELKLCLNKSMKDIIKIQREINRRSGLIEQRKAEVEWEEEG